MPRAACLCFIMSLFFRPSLVQADPRIGVVDMKYVLEESIVGKAAKANLEQELKQRQSTLERSRINVKGLVEEFQKHSSLLSEEAREKKKEKIALADRALKRQIKDLQDEIKVNTHRAIDKIVEEVTKIVQEVAKTEGYEFILERDRQFVVFAADEVDLSKEVVRLLDEKKLEL